MTLTLKTAKHAVGKYGEVSRIVEHVDNLYTTSVTRAEAEDISEYDPNFKPCIVVTTAREALEAAWDAAHSIPETVTTIPPGTPIIIRGPKGITFIDEGYDFPTRVNGFGEMELRTLTPLLKPEPWEESRYCYADGDIYKRFHILGETFWLRPGYKTTYYRDAIAKLNPRPLDIE